jgi:hypothetical protein
METIKKEPLLPGLLIMFLATMIFANIGGNMYGSLMPLYLKDMDTSITQIGLFFTLAQVVPLLFGFSSNFPKLKNRWWRKICPPWQGDKDN